MTAPDLYRTLQWQGFKLKVEKGQIMVAPFSKLTPELREALKEHKAFILHQVTIPRLPWQLENLVNAASSGVLQLDLPGVPDSARYVMAWACSYLTGGRTEAQRRLWAAYHAWWSREMN